MKMLQERATRFTLRPHLARERREDVEKVGVTCWEIPFARSPYSPANIQAYRKLKDLLRKHHFDLIHVHTPVAAFWGDIWLKLPTRVPSFILPTAFIFTRFRGAIGSSIILQNASPPAGLMASSL